MRRRLLLSAGPAVLVTVVVAAALASSGGSRGAHAGAATATQPAYEELPTRNTRAKAVEPVAGETAESASLPTEEDPAPRPASRSASAPRPRSAKRRSTGPTGDAAISDAEVLKGGLALPPLEAPQPVHDIIEAGNSIARTPYLWGGGHGKWLDKGYDCSGSVSYALAAGGLLSGPLDSGRLMGWGKPGPGRWVTIYTNPGHVFMVVAGVRFDTSGNRVTGSRWQASMRPTGGFVARHPPGL